MKWYQCQTGHRFSPESLMVEQDGNLEEHLWTVLALLKQKAETARTMAADARSVRGTRGNLEYFEKQAHTADEVGEMIQKIVEEKRDELFPGLPQKSVSKMEETQDKAQKQ